MKRTALALVLAISAACGSSDSPTGPTYAQAGGVWAASVRLVAASGGDCVGPTISAVSLGAVTNYTMQITQSGSTLTAIVTDTSTGVRTNFTGTAGTSTIAMNGTFSSAAIISGFPCLSGVRRDLNLTNVTFNGNINGNTGNGTEAESYNVFVAGTTAGVGVMILNGNFTMTRQ